MLTLGLVKTDVHKSQHCSKFPLETHSELQLQKYKAILQLSRWLDMSWQSEGSGQKAFIDSCDSGYHGKQTIMNLNSNW